MSVREDASTTVTGRPRRRIDAPEKLTAATRYAGDVAGRHAVRTTGAQSTCARAHRPDRFSRGSAAARRGRGTHRGDLRVQRVDDLGKSDPLARDKALWVGQPVAIVVAETEAAAEDAAARVDVTYEPLPPILDLEAALQAGASNVRERVSGGGSAEAAHGSTVGAGGEVAYEGDSRNIANRLHYQRGDVVRGFSEATVVVERTCRTSTFHQFYLEPQTATAAVDPLGKLTMWSRTQSVFYTRKQLANSRGLPVDRVRVVAMPLRGGFGGKILVIDFGAGNPASGSHIWLKIGAARDGRLTNIQARVVFDAGAFPELSPAGWALYEQVPYDETGQPLAASFIDYPLPPAQRVPNVEPVPGEVQAADGPFGGKGVGEPPVVAGAAAIGNAVADARRVRMSELPITSERLFRALAASSAQ
jgi:CO/xanthine dehydrogenase Mo-binding subunit